MKNKKVIKSNADKIQNRIKQPKRKIKKLNSNLKELLF